MAKYYPCGVVLAGEYEGSFVYNYSDYDLAIIANKSVSVTFGQVNAVVQKMIGERTVKSIEVTGSEPKKADFANAGAVAVLLGAVAGYAVHENSKGLLYTCTVKYKDGKKSLIKIDDSVYPFIQKLMFNLNE